MRASSSVLLMLLQLCWGQDRAVDQHLASPALESVKYTVLRPGVLIRAQRITIDDEVVRCALPELQCTLGRR